MKPPSGEAVIEWVLARTVSFTIYAVLLATGALLGSYYPPVFWWFMGAAGLSLLCIAVLFGLALAAAAMPDGPD